uniref:Orphan G-protein coupled receptor 11 n=1 Tax=Platynereis dumerilii TaxID=6359 RepID=A0A0K0PUF1_PLADU|nr:orphan G-protein coupled receptor 11 [Platynereis dumerilii]
MEIVGLSVSLVSLSISLFIFFYFRSLKCDRTRIHRNLFLAIMIHVMIQLIVHIDQYIAKNSGNAVGGSIVLDNKGTMYNTPILCEVLKTMVEYTKTVMFVWMFIEGMYLHNMLVVSVFTGRPKYMLFYILGWGFPIILTLTWVITNWYLDSEKCWFTYSFLPQYWILEGPRAAIIAVNLFFLLNIIRVLVTKLRESHSNEAEQVRKAVKAAIVLLPLLGVNNFLVMVDLKLGHAVKFAVYMYTSKFLASFQGFFIALLYCFLNAEVREKLNREYQLWRLAKGYVPARTSSKTVTVYTAANCAPMAANGP